MCENMLAYFLSSSCKFYLFGDYLDAHFTIRVPGSDPLQSQVYLCVADGVGSWRQYGVDPRQFSHRLGFKISLSLSLSLSP